MDATDHPVKQRVYQNRMRLVIVLDTKAPRWVFHRPRFAGEGVSRMDGPGWETWCGHLMWSGRHGRGPGCIGNRAVIEQVARPCRHCFPEPRTED